MQEQPEGRVPRQMGIQQEWGRRRGSALRKYQDLVVGSRGLGRLLL